MKKLLLILLISSYAIAQQPDVEIRLVNESIGYPNYINVSQANSSNDAGLNAILQTYNVNSYINKFSHPYLPYINRIISVYGTYPSQFIADLLAYSSVVESVHISEMNTFSDAVQLQLLDLNIGSPTGFNGNIVTTNDTGLNQIFQDFNVFYYAQTYPSSTVNSSLSVYDVVCNCDKNILKLALDNYTATIQSTQNVSAGFMLSNNSFEKSKAIVSPNPFLNDFNIETEESITNYSVFDISGKQIIATSNKNELDNQATKLQAGMYVLNLVFENGQTSNSKLVKK